MRISELSTPVYDCAISTLADKPMPPKEELSAGGLRHGLMPLLCKTRGCRCQHGIASPGKAAHASSSDSSSPFQRITYTRDPVQDWSVICFHRPRSFVCRTFKDCVALSRIKAAQSHLLRGVCKPHTKRTIAFGTLDSRTHSWHLFREGLLLYLLATFLSYAVGLLYNCVHNYSSACTCDCASCAEQDVN